MFLFPYLNFKYGQKPKKCALMKSVAFEISLRFPLTKIKQPVFFFFSKTIRIIVFGSFEIVLFKLNLLFKFAFFLSAGKKQLKKTFVVDEEKKITKVLG